MTKPPPPSPSLAPDDLRTGKVLTERLIEVAADHARAGAAESVVVAALSSALGCVAAAVARSNGYDLGRYQEFIARHVAHVFEAESRRVVYSIH